MKQAKDVAKQATGNDPDYLKVIDRLQLDATFPLEVSKVLESSLRRLLGINERGLKLHDLLTQARDAERLPDEALDLAHTIRRQRNIVAHEQVDNRTHIGRVLLVLYASAVLWPHLPEV